MQHRSCTGISVQQESVPLLFIDICRLYSCWNFCLRFRHYDGKIFDGRVTAVIKLFNFFGFLFRKGEGGENHYKQYDYNILFGKESSHS